jgi:hypothetical protein
VIGAAPPFSLTAPAFRFRALTMLAGRAPLGGEREMTLALLMVARLAEGLILPSPLSEAARRTRGAGARVWLSTLTLPAAMRIPLARVVEATEHGNHGVVAETILAAAELVQSVLDPPSRHEITDLIAALRER